MSSPPAGQPRFDLVVFDCDGVLVDSERISVRIGVSVMADLGWQVTEQEFARRFVGCSEQHFNREVAAALGRPLQPGWDVPYADRYRTAYAAELGPVPGVEAVLDALDDCDVPYCVASNSDHAHLQRVLASTGLLARFEGRVFSARDVNRGKPAPDVYLHVAAQMGHSPDRCAVVEDSPFGVAAARNAGMTCFAFAGGVTPAARLTGTGATLVADMVDLIGLLTGGVAAAHRETGKRMAPSTGLTRR
jgi:HAD superfamily hydrolase (TIGR01509 family)